MADTLGTGRAPIVKEVPQEEFASNLQVARRLLDEGKLDDSFSAHKALLSLSAKPTNVAEAFYGFGTIGLIRKNLPYAKLNFQKCIGLNPSHANAYYYLGEIAEGEASTVDAVNFYKAAVAFQANHKAALRKLGELDCPVHSDPEFGEYIHTPLHIEPKSNASSHGSHQVEPEPSVSSHGSHHVDPEPNAFLNYIRQDNSPLAKQALAAIESLERKSSARISAFIPYIFINLAFTLVFTLWGVAWLILLPAAIILFCIAFISLACAIPAIVWRGKTTHYTITDGRIIIEKGLIFRSKRNVELYRVEDIVLKQDLMDRMTHNGKLTLKLGHGFSGSSPYVTLRGLAEISELEKLFVQLRNTVLLLRTGAWGKGVIY